jgi:NTE family protein
MNGKPIETAATSLKGLIEPCPANPDPPPTPIREPCEFLAVSLSGGGWRAALTGAGALRFLVDAGLLGRVRWVSSVSGGSITNGLLAHSYRGLREVEFSPTAFDEAVLRPLLGKARDRSLTRALIGRAWRALGPKSRTDVMADVFDDWFFGGLLLAELPEDCDFVFNAANAATGVRFGFERERLGDYVTGYVKSAETTVRLADAVAASAAVPGPFAAMRLRGLKFPCGNGADTRLLDGGVYDNLGLEAIDDLYGPCLVIVSAGGVLRRGMGGLLRFIPVLRDLKRSEELLYRQATALRSRAMVERFRVWEQTLDHDDRPDFARRGVLFGLATTIDDVAREWLEGRPEQLPGAIEPRKLAESETTFSRRSPGLCRDLIYRGWWLTGAQLTTFHPGLLDRLPSWRKLP